MPALRRRAVVLICFVSLVAALWFWLGRWGEVAWLTVEGPTHVVVGEPVQLRVHLTRGEQDALLCADLHWASDRNTPEGFLAAGDAKVAVHSGGTFDFRVPVPARDNLRFVNGIIYLSPDGQWSNHTFVATTELIPITRTRDGRAPVLVRWPLRQLAEDFARIAPSRSPLLRWATGLTWLLAAAVLVRQLRPARNVSMQHTKIPRGLMTVAAGFALAGIWELAGLENLLGNQARSLARAEDLYYPRATFQKLVIAVTIAAALVGLALAWRKCVARPWLLAFGLYLAVTLVNLLSLHVVDQFAGRSWHGVAFVDAMGLLCAVTAMVSLLRTKSPTGAAA